MNVAGKVVLLGQMLQYHANIFTVTTCWCVTGTPCSSSLDFSCIHWHCDPLLSSNRRPSADTQQVSDIDTRFVCLYLSAHHRWLTNWPRRGLQIKFKTSHIIIFIVTLLLYLPRITECGCGSWAIGEVRDHILILCGVCILIRTLPHCFKKHGNGVLFHGCSYRIHHRPLHHLPGSVYRHISKKLSVLKPQSVFILIKIQQCIITVSWFNFPSLNLYDSFTFLTGKYFRSLPYILMGSLAIAGSLLCLLLPETSKRPLPETLLQMQPICGWVYIPGASSLYLKSFVISIGFSSGLLQGLCLASS